MSSAGTSQLVPSSPAASKPKKPKKKKPGGKGNANGSAEKTNGNSNETGDVLDEEDTEEPDTPIVGAHPQDQAEEVSVNGTDRSAVNGVSKSLGGLSLQGAQIAESDPPMPKSPTNTRPRKATLDHGAQEKSEGDILENGTEARLDALAKEREALRDEVTQLRKSLEEIQGKHGEELSDVRAQLEESQEETDRAKKQYENLLGRVNTIKSQLGDRLKADAEELAQARSQIEELEEQNTNLQEQKTLHVAEVARLKEEDEQRSKELSSLRNRMNLSQQNWVKEREDLVQKEAFAREEFDAAKQAMQEWEVLAMEERSIRENLEERVSDLEDQVKNHRDGHMRAAAERDSQALTVDGLQRALQEIQDARKRELREVVENSQLQVERLGNELHEAQAKAAESTNALEAAKKELERVLPFEMEVKEKNLLIGKLRHEAVILNDHLTKALRYLKKGKPEDNIDKQLVTNHFLHFLALERSDPKKFQVLQIIASLLGWTDEQREQAGLARPGASNPSLRTPISPWHRTPSTPSLSVEFFPESARGRGESIGGLWQEFLEQEAQGDTSTTGRSSRSTSISSAMRGRTE